MIDKLMEKFCPGDTIYFTSYGIAEALEVKKVITEEAVDYFTGTLYAARSDGTTEQIDFNDIGVSAFRDKASAEKALKTADDTVIPQPANMGTLSAMATLVKKTTANQAECCPHCGESYYIVNDMTSTCAYYPPIYQNGVNINPDRNKTTVNCTCLKCGKKFTL